MKYLNWFIYLLYENNVSLLQINFNNEKVILHNCFFTSR